MSYDAKNRVFKNYMFLNRIHIFVQDKIEIINQSGYSVNNKIYGTYIMHYMMFKSRDYFLYTLATF